MYEVEQVIKKLVSKRVLSTGKIRSTTCVSLGPDEKEEQCYLYRLHDTSFRKKASLGGKEGGGKCTECELHDVVGWCHNRTVIRAFA